MEPEHEHLRPDPDELRQRYDFSRHIFQLFISWFTIFCGLNIAVLGWVASSTFRDTLPHGRTTGWVLSMFMFVQNALGIAACAAVRKVLRATHRRILTLISAQSVAQPTVFYCRAIILCMAACATYMLVWIIVPIVAPWQD